MSLCYMRYLQYSDARLPVLVNTPAARKEHYANLIIFLELLAFRPAWFSEPLHVRSCRLNVFRDSQEFYAIL